MTEQYEYTEDVWGFFKQFPEGKIFNPPLEVMLNDGTPAFVNVILPDMRCYGFHKMAGYDMDLYLSWDFSWQDNLKIERNNNIVSIGTKPEPVKYEENKIFEVKS